MEFDYSALRGRIVEHFGSMAAFASAVNISRSSVSQKINNKIDGKQTEIEKARVALKISVPDVPKYFFTQEVWNIELSSKKQTVQTKSEVKSVSYSDLLQDLKEGIQTGRIPLITNPYIEDSYRKAYAEPFIRALDAGIDALDKRQTEP